MIIIVSTSKVYTPNSRPIYSVSDLTKPENGVKAEPGKNGNGLANIVNSANGNYEYQLPEGFPDDLTGKEDPLEIVIATHYRFSRLIRTLAARVLSGFAHADAENVEQNVYMNLLNRYGTYKPGRKFSSWLGQMAINAAIDYQRNAFRKWYPDKSLDDNDSDNPSSGALHDYMELLADKDLVNDPESSAELSELMMHLEYAISILPEEQRHAIVEHRIKGLTHVEVSSRDGIPLGTLKTRVRLGSKKIRAYMGEQGYLDSLVE